MTPTPLPLPPVSALPGLSLDAAVWDAMVDAAGPQDAVWLVRQILADLNRMGDGMRASLAEGDEAALGRASHALAGLGGTIGAPHLQDAAQRLSHAIREKQGSTTAALGTEVLATLATVQVLVAQRLLAMDTA